MSISKKLLQAAAGNAGESLYVEDVFSTYLYTGNSSTQTITNGIDLDGEGGLVWIKGRSAAYSHYLFDTERGFTAGDDGNFISSNNTNAESSTGNFGVSAFNSNGFSLHGSWNGVNNSPQTFASWSFRKAEKFFDGVIYTGDGSSPRNIDHNLGSVPGCMIVKSTSTADAWYVWHTSVGSGSFLTLADTSAAQPYGSFTWASTDPTDTQFTTGVSLNSSGTTYVAYLFASDAGGFGDDGSESIIKCGSYTGNGSSSGPTIDLGFEPQFVMIKAATTYTSGNWLMLDTMRGWTANSGNQTGLYANLSDAEIAANSGLSPTATGFQIRDTTPQINGSGNTYIYIAIRRPMMTPTAGTEVFNSVAQTNGGSSPYPVTAGFSVDSAWFGQRNGWGVNFITSDRLRGATNLLLTTSTNSEATNNSTYGPSSSRLDSNTQFFDGMTNVSEPDIYWMFKRATGFFDVVAYTGTGVAGVQIPHNLAVPPELLIVKPRNQNSEWEVYAAPLGATKYIRLARSDAAGTLSAFWNDTDPTSSVFTLGSAGSINNSAIPCITYLFATLAGVSKVGSYTGTGADLNVDCGFSAGARFILIKRTDSTGDWYVWDSERGIVAGNDPYLLLNSTAAEVTSTDYIDPLSSGFTVTSSAPAALNASGGTYIFLSIA